MPSYEGHYQVSNFGRVKSLSREINNNGGVYICKERLLKPALDTKGYYRYKLYLDDVSKTFKAHRLVMFVFVGESDLQVNHKNGIKTDNRLENLEYVTNLQNTHHACKNNLRESKLNEKAAREIKYGCERPSVLALKYNITMTMVSRIRRGLTWKHI